MDDVQVALPSDWGLVELTGPRWEADLAGRETKYGVGVALVTSELAAVESDGGVLAAVDLEDWRTGVGRIISVTTEAGYGKSLDDWRASVRADVAEQGGELLDLIPATDDRGRGRGREGLYIGYGDPATGVVTSRFLVVDDGTAWSVSLSAPDGPDLAGQATTFDEVAATFDLAR